MWVFLVAQRAAVGGSKGEAGLNLQNSDLMFVLQLGRWCQCGLLRKRSTGLLDPKKEDMKEGLICSRSDWKIRCAESPLEVPRVLNSQELLDNGILYMHLGTSVEHNCWLHFSSLSMLLVSAYPDPPELFKRKYHQGSDIPLTFLGWWPSAIAPSHSSLIWASK